MKDIIKNKNVTRVFDYTSEDVLFAGINLNSKITKVIRKSKGFLGKEFQMKIIDTNNINNENIRPNEVNRKNKNIEKIDINTAGIDDIKKLPGITIISAKKLIQYRENGNYVKSMYDLGEKLNLKDYQLEQLRPYVLISKNKEYTTTNYTRRVDL